MCMYFIYICIWINPLGKMCTHEHDTSTSINKVNFARALLQRIVLLSSVMRRGCNTVRLPRLSLFAILIEIFHFYTIFRDDVSIS